jgi:hypothetical protein
MTRRTPTGLQATSAPTEDERRIAGEASRRLAAFPATATRLEIHAASQPEEVVEIPAAVLPLLRQVLDQIADGTPVAVLADDVIDHKRRDQAERLKALEELAAQAQELGLGY